ncbi:MAG: ABC transporter ATP-binding protein [Pseudomonadota bacterium]
MTASFANRPSLVASDISYELSDGTQLIRNISLDVNAGDIVAIVGPNGAGKTTLIRMIAGLTAPTTGSILLDGIAVDQMSFADRAKQIAYLGQSDNVDGRLTVSQYIGLGLLPHGRLFAGNLSAELSKDALSAVGLDKFADRRMDQLSGGEMQKAKIARAICQRPKLLVLDEPTNHLDPHARGELLGLIAQMGITIVAALHDLTLIEAFADKTAMIANGRLLTFGNSVDALSTDQVLDVFGVDLHRLSHPHQDRLIPTLDIPISKTLNARAAGSVSQH